MLHKYKCQIPVEPFPLVQKSLIFGRIKEAIFLSRFIVYQTRFRDFITKTLHRPGLSCEQPLGTMKYK